MKPTARRLAAAGLLVVAGCGGAQPTPAVQVGAERGFTITFPAPPKQRQGHEGPRVQSYLASAVDEDDRVFEVAVFTIARPLSLAEQTDLLGRVLRGLAARPGGRSFAAAPTTDGADPSLSHSATMVLDDQRRGRWLIFYADRRRMVQLSVVGPDDEELTERSATFFDSFALEPATR